MFVAQTTSDYYLPAESLSALAEPGVVAEEILMRFCAPLHRGSRVLILGANEGVGLLTLQACTRMKDVLELSVSTHAPASAGQKAVALGKANGAHEVVVGDAGWAMSSVWRSNSFDLVVDTMPSSTKYRDAARRVLVPGGTLVSYDPLGTLANPVTSGVKAHMVNLLRTVLKPRDRKGIAYEFVGCIDKIDPMTAQWALESIRQAIEEGSISPRISVIVPLEDAHRAFEEPAFGIEGTATVIRMAS